MVAPLAAAGIGALGSIGGGLLAGRSSQPRESRLEKKKRKLVDDLLASLQGGGSFNDLYSMDENAFNKSFVEPAQARFRNQIAPQIQQQFLASGQHRGTGLEDTLTRAGVDLDAMLNEQYGNFQQGAMNRQQNTISNILGMQGDVQPGTSFGQDLGAAASGYLSSPSFQNTISSFYPSSPSQQPQAPASPVSQNQRKGFQPEGSDFLKWGLNDPRWGQ